MRTAEEIAREYKTKMWEQVLGQKSPDTFESIVEVIRTAQREALEAAARECESFLHHYALEIARKIRQLAEGLGK